MQNKSIGYLKYLVLLHLEMLSYNIFKSRRRSFHLFDHCVPNRMNNNFFIVRITRFFAFWCSYMPLKTRLIEIGFWYKNKALDRYKNLKKITMLWFNVKIILRTNIEKTYTFGVTCTNLTASCLHISPLNVIFL